MQKGVRVLFYECRRLYVYSLRETIGMSDSDVEDGVVDIMFALWSVVVCLIIPVGSRGSDTKCRVHEHYIPLV